MSVFISIASYRDPELIKTVNSAIENASGHNDIYFGIVIQDIAKNIPKELDEYSFVEYISMHPRKARGAGYARSLAMSLYIDQDYFLQIDSHTRFSKNWDVKCIEQLNLAEQQNKKAIISAYPMPYIPQHGADHLVNPEPNNIRTYPSKQKANKRKNGDWSSIREEFDNPESPKPELSTVVLGGFIFARGFIVNELPYDPEISFFGEELCFSARAWTRGYDIFSPKIPILYHFYTRPRHNKIWNDIGIREVPWSRIEKNSRYRQAQVLLGAISDEYGLGNVRPVSEYERLIGYQFSDHFNLHN